MVCVGMGSALPLSFRKGFPLGKAGDMRTRMLVGLPPAKNLQAPTLLLFYHCLPLQNAPRGSPRELSQTLA
jgi:hypothetical protein